MNILFITITLLLSLQAQSKVPLTQFAFEHNRCKWTNTKHYVMGAFSYKGTFQSFEVEPLAEESVNSDENLKVTFFKKNKSKIFEVTKNNPFYKDVDVHKKYQTLDCNFSLLVEFPSELDLSEVFRVRFQANGFQQDLLIDPVMKKQKPILIAEKSYDKLNEVPRKAYRVYGDSPSDKAWDLVFVTDGFTKDDFDIHDKNSILDEKKSLGFWLKVLTDELLSREPYSRYKDNINIWVVATHSNGHMNGPERVPMPEILAEENADEYFLSRDKYFNWEKEVKKFGYEFDTLLKTSSGNQCSERLLTIKEGRLAFNLANTVPFDNLMVLVNSKLYSAFGAAVSHLTISPLMDDSRILHKIKSTFVHELAHNLAHLDDEYSHISNLNFIDESACDKILVKDVMILKNHIGSMAGTGLFADDKNNAPDVTIHKDRKMAKWSRYLDENSPIVDFIHPSKTKGVKEIYLKDGVYTEERQMYSFPLARKVTFHFNSKESKNNIIFGNYSPILFNSWRALYPLNTNFNEDECSFELFTKQCRKKLDDYNESFISSLVVNGKEIPREKFSVQTEVYAAKNLSFIEIDAPLLVGLNTIDFKFDTNLRLRSHSRKESILPINGEFRLKNAFKFFLASQKFSLTDIGLFQGSAVSLTQVYRPTFISGMGDIWAPYNQVQIDAIELALFKHIVID